MNYKQEILAYSPVNAQEMSEKKVILEYIERFPETILLRENEFAHLTSSGFIMNEMLDKVLMVHHNIYKTWAWTGGHADGDEDLLHVALKEATEETGIKHIKPLMNTIASLDILPVWGHIKRGCYVPTHMHLSVAYILIADEKEAVEINREENSGVMWIPIEELEKYCNEPEILVVYHKLIQQAKNYVANKA